MKKHLPIYFMIGSTAHKLDCIKHPLTYNVIANVQEDLSSRYNLWVKFKKGVIKENESGEKIFVKFPYLVFDETEFGKIQKELGTRTECVHFYYGATNHHIFNIMSIEHRSMLDEKFKKTGIDAYYVS